MTPNSPDEALKQLLGLSISDIKFAEAMPMLAFGELKTVTFGKRGRTKQVGAYALHIECPWRLTREQSILVGSDDFFVQLAEGTHRNLLGLRVRAFLELGESERTVINTETEPLGGFKLFLGSNMVFEVLPMISSNESLWRLFEPGNDDNPFVAVKG